MELSNRETIARLGAVEVLTLPQIDLADPDGWPELKLRLRSDPGNLPARPEHTLPTGSRA